MRRDTGVLFLFSMNVQFLECFVILGTHTMVTVHSLQVVWLDAILGDFTNMWHSKPRGDLLLVLT